MNRTTTLDRRGFLRGAAASATVAAGVTALGTHVAFADPLDTSRGDVVVQVFLRGGADCLSILPPVGYGSYYDHRRNGAADVSISTSEALSIGHSVFAFHPQMAPLLPAWNAGHLAVIPAAGVPASLSSVRSHFEMQDIMEHGGPTGTSTGWLARHIQTSSDTESSGISGLTLDRYPHASLAGTAPGIVSFDQTGEFEMFGYNDRARVASAFSTMYPASDTRLLNDGQTALRSIARVRQANPLAIAPQTTYGSGTFDRRLKETAQLIRSGVGVRAVAMSAGSWDVHNAMGNASRGPQRDQIAELATGLGHFYADLGSQMNEVTVVVLSEFGRTNAVNGSGGTDHGRGGIMLALGRRVRGGIHGDFPSKIEEGPEGDLAVITDYRRVLAELVTKRLDNGANLGTVFPGYSHPGDLGVFAG